MVAKPSILTHTIPNEVQATEASSMGRDSDSRFHQKEIEMLVHLLLQASQGSSGSLGYDVYRTY